MVEHRKILYILADHAGVSSLTVKHLAEKLAIELEQAGDRGLLKEPEILTK